MDLGRIAEKLENRLNFLPHEMWRADIDRALADAFYLGAKFAKDRTAPPVVQPATSPFDGITFEWKPMEDGEVLWSSDGLATGLISTDGTWAAHLPSAPLAGRGGKANDLEDAREAVKDWLRAQGAKL